MAHYLHTLRSLRQRRCKVAAFQAYTSVLAVLSGALLLVVAGLTKKQLTWKRPSPVRVRFRRRSS
jgi:hypothetical protein